MKIFALFSIACNYDQPEHNLVAWWASKPDFATLAQAIGLPGFPCAKDEQTLLVVNLWQGQAVQDAFNTQYSLEEIPEGVVK